MNQRTKYVGQRLFRPYSKVTDRSDRQTHTRRIALPGLDH